MSSTGTALLGIYFTALGTGAVLACVSGLAPILVLFRLTLRMVYVTTAVSRSDACSGWITPMPCAPTSHAT